MWTTVHLFKKNVGGVPGRLTVSTAKSRPGDSALILSQAMAVTSTSCVRLDCGLTGAVSFYVIRRFGSLCQSDEQLCTVINSVVNGNDKNGPCYTALMFNLL